MISTIPIVKRLRKESHRQIALAQDIVVEEVYKYIPHAVFHGGTAIWRCYNGRRFSEDLDFYFPPRKNALETVFSSLEKRGFKIIKKKISKRSVYSELIFNRVSVRLEGTFQRISGQIVDYEKIDGTRISIYGLSVERLIKEKATTYLKRKKVRDLWDVFFLLKNIRNIDLIGKEIKRLIDEYEPPLDKENLKAIIIEGITPSPDEMMNYIKRKWENLNI